jgi:hypothetical protein
MTGPLEDPPTDIDPQDAFQLFILSDTSEATVRWSVRPETGR